MTLILFLYILNYPLTQMNIWHVKFMRSNMHFTLRKNEFPLCGCSLLMLKCIDSRW